MPKQFKQPSVMEPQHRFSKVPRADIPRSRFNRSHGNKLTMDSGKLYPIFVDEALPGDTFSMRPTILARMATPLFPLMDNLYLDVFFFAVPNRLLWDNWEKFCGMQDDPGDSTDFVIPQVTAPGGGWPADGIADYFGIPTGVEVDVNALPFRAYSFIFNEWFRDQNVQNSLSWPSGDGPDNSNLYTVWRRGKRHDYFTSCLPFPQKGPTVPLPLGTVAPVVPVDTSVPGGSFPTFRDTSDTISRNLEFINASVNTEWDQSNAITSQQARWDDPGLETDLSAATAATINQLRESFQIQRLLERDARGGTRYTEVVLSHFGVSSPDARLQRPEFLGGASVPINVTPFGSATENVDRNLGDLAAYAVGLNSDGSWSKSFTEHCVLLGLVSVRADLTYQQGLDRMWSRQTRYDFYWPVLAHLGEQAVLNKEIFAQGTSVDDDVFGYQERWAEYRYKPSRICGDFRSNAAASLDAWHLSQDFASLPVLNTTFIQDTPPVSRVIATPSDPQFLVDCWFDLKCARPMPVYSVPGLIDHF